MSFGAAVLAVALAIPAAAQQGKARPSTLARVRYWTQTRWDAAKAEFQRDRVKWDACSQKAATQHLKGRWSFIYDCMKS